MADLTCNARQVLEARYLRRDTDGQITETPEELFRRVARAVAVAEATHGGPSVVGHWTEVFEQLLASLDFLPNSPTLMNAGTTLGQLSACFVLSVEDSIDGIFDSLKLMALIQQSGGGTGFSFSRLRPQGDFVTSTGGIASGPVSFIRLYDAATENIRQGGKRRGANMGVLRVDHPDIEEFIDAKLDDTGFRNFNLSVGATDQFMEAVASNQSFPLRHPGTGKEIRAISAGGLMQRIAEAAWRSGDPGMLFLDTINRTQPTPELGPIEATNPCGEVPLLPYEACTLGSINLRHMVRESAAGRQINWDKLAEVTRHGLRFLDNVIDVGRWPDPRIERAVRGNRKVGLGVMGFAEMLILLGIPYASAAAVLLVEELMAFIAGNARAASEELASQRGTFPQWQQSVHADLGLRIRNATLTSIAPTGTIGIIAGTSAGIEPLFALAFRREHVLNGQRMLELNPLFAQFARQQGFYSQNLVRDLHKHGSLAEIPGVPETARGLFRTALEIAPEDHLRIQSAFQKHVDNAVSKTINLPGTAVAKQIGAIYQQAWENGLKGVTVYRYGSKGQQVLNLGTAETPEQHEPFSRCDPDACRL